MLPEFIKFSIHQDSFFTVRIIYLIAKYVKFSLHEYKNTVILSRSEGSQKTQ